jgi:hypothetical protein
MSDFRVTPEPTPNPNAMKFVATRTLNEGPTRTFYNAEAAAGDSLAAKLFALPGVTGVMLVRDFCSVNQDGSQDWDSLSVEVVSILREHYRG